MKKFIKTILTGHCPCSEKKKHRLGRRKRRRHKYTAPTSNPIDISKATIRFVHFIEMGIPDSFPVAIESTTFNDAYLTGVLFISEENINFALTLSTIQRLFLEEKKGVINEFRLDNEIYQCVLSFEEEDAMRCDIVLCDFIPDLRVDFIHRYHKRKKRTAFSCPFSRSEPKMKTLKLDLDIPFPTPPFCPPFGPPGHHINRGPNGRTGFPPHPLHALHMMMTMFGACEDASKAETAPEQVDMEPMKIELEEEEQNEQEEKQSAFVSEVSAISERFYELIQKQNSTCHSLLSDRGGLEQVHIGFPQPVEVFVQRFYGVNLEAIANGFKVSKNTVKRRLRKMREMLLKELVLNNTPIENIARMCAVPEEFILKEIKRLIKLFEMRTH
ncbi:hypothetical protein PCE1_002807 [Barthelona sp. PCE]